MQNKYHCTCRADRWHVKLTSVLSRGPIFEACEFHQRFVVEPDCGAIVAAGDRMSDAIGFAGIEKKDAGRISHHILPACATFDIHSSPRKNEHMPGRFFFRTKCGLSRTTTPIRDGHQRARKKLATM